MSYSYCRPLRIVLGLISVVSMWLFVARQANACHDNVVCVEINPELEDAHFGLGGEGYFPWKARGMRVTIIRPFPEPPLGLYLDQEGCTTFESQFHAGFKLFVYPEVVLGSTNNIRIKAFTIEQEDQEATTPEFALVPPVPEGSMAVVSIPHSEIWSLIAVATHVVQRIDTDPLLGTSALTGIHDLRIQRTNAPNSQALDMFEAGDNAHDHKFVIGHELGHWIQRQVELDLDAEGVFAYYGYDAVDDPCKFGVTTVPAGSLGEHGIRSAEHSNAAMIEGFGHFVSSVAFNAVDSEYGIFRYYKDIDVESYPDYDEFFNEGDSKIQLRGGTDNETTRGGQSAWVMNQCTAHDWSFPEHSDPLGKEVTSEIDWLRFFWRLITADEMEFGNAMAFWDVPYLLAYGHAHFQWVSDGSLYCNVFSALMDSDLSGYEDRFVDLTEENGVYNGSPYACLP